MAKPLSISMENLNLVPTGVLKPSFNRDKIKTSILHIGVSNFHRSHQAYYINEYIEKHKELNFGICGIDLLDSDRKIYNILKDQDGLYTLYVKEKHGNHKAKIIGAIVEYFYGPENPMAVIEKMANPDIKIISLTIAEDGYLLDTITGAFNINHPYVNEDTKNPFSPQTVFGYLTQAFKLRKLRGLSGCTILSCDNIQSNGTTIKQAFFNYVNATEPNLLPWLKENTRFPNSMVDRITPITTLDDIDSLKKDFIIEDQWPVVCESFSRWVIEDDFLHPKPSWDKVGVEFTKNIEPFEQMKLRLLNAGHTILGILGTLHGYTTVYEASTDEDFARFLKNYMDKEVSTTLSKPESENISAYKNEIISRFQNPHINDSLSRICQESSAKIPIFIIPTIIKQLATEKNIKRGAFVMAAWCKYNDGFDDQDKPYKINDRLSGTLIRNAALSQHDPIKFLETHSVFGELSNNTLFTETYKESLHLIRTHKIKECVRLFNRTA